MLALALAVVSTPPGLGQDSTPLGSNEIPLMRSQFERWKERGSQIETHVRDGNYKKAESGANGLLRDLLNKLTGGPDAGRILAMPLSLRALARVGLKREDDALWDYQMAAVVWPSLAKVRLSDYGPTGVRLAQLVEEADLARRASTHLPSGEAEPDTREVTRPMALSKHGIEFPVSLRIAMRTGQAVIALFIDEEGRPHAPQIEGAAAQNAIFLFAAMDGVRDWRFRPAMFQGKPIACIYTLTVNYRLTG